MTLSIVISVHNGEAVLKECLNSAAFADEIVVVDHESTDKTVAIARKYTKRIYSQKNDPTNIDIQKNFGFEKAKGDWIFSLDADERIPKALASEIREVIERDDVYAGYRIPRKNIIFGKWIAHGLWWPDYQLRLFRKGKGRFVKRKVHQDLSVDGQVGTLRSFLEHQNYQTLSQYLQKMDRYTENEANSLIEEQAHIFWFDAIRMPTRDFLKTFFFQQGYKDGLHGLVLSLLQAFYSFLVFAKVWEKQGFREENKDGFLTTLYNEWILLQKEISYWFFTSLLSSTRNPLLKMKFWILRKLSTPSSQRYNEKSRHFHN